MGPKIPSLGIFDQKCVIWVFLDNNFKRTIVIFEISTLKVVYFQNFAKKQKCLNLGPKMPHLSIFGLEFEKTNVLFEISTLKFVKSEWLFHTVNFGIGSAFSKGLESAFFLKVRVRVWVWFRFIKYAVSTPTSEIRSIITF